MDSPVWPVNGLVTAVPGPRTVGRELVGILAGQRVGDDRQRRERPRLVVLGDERQVEAALGLLQVAIHWAAFGGTLKVISPVSFRVVVVGRRSSVRRGLTRGQQLVLTDGQDLHLLVEHRAGLVHEHPLGAAVADDVLRRHRRDHVLAQVGDGRRALAGARRRASPSRCRCSGDHHVDLVTRHEEAADAAGPGRPGC